MFPFLPTDFDERYYQAAPVGQQIPIPKGPTEVVLRGFTLDGERRFMLPYIEAPVHVFPKRGGREELLAKIDTIVFEPDLERVTMSWRVARPLQKSLHELAQVVAGVKGRAWWQQREQVAIVAPMPTVAMPQLAPATAKA